MGSPGGGGNTEIASFLILHVGIIIMPLMSPPSAASTGKTPAVPPSAALPPGRMGSCPLALQPGPWHHGLPSSTHRRWEHPPRHLQWHRQSCGAEHLLLHCTCAATAGCHQGRNLSLQGANPQHATSPWTLAPKCLFLTNHSYPSASWGPVSAVPVASAATSSPVPGSRAPGCDSTAALGHSCPENAKENWVQLQPSHGHLLLAALGKWQGWRLPLAR